MIRRLRLRMVAVIMSIVTLLLCLMVFTVLQLTRSNLERESLVMMEGAAHEPFREERPDEDFTGIRLPYFMLRIGDDGQPQPIGGDYYTLTDEDFLLQITEQANASPEDLASWHSITFASCVSIPRKARFWFLPTYPMKILFWPI